MNVLLYVFGGIFGLCVILGGIYWWFSAKNNKKYPFKLYSKDGSSAKTLYGAIRLDINNKLNKKFFLKDLNASLELSDPSFFENGVGFREIIINEKGEPSYITREVTRGEHLKLALTPEEKSLAMFRFKDSQNRYPEQMSKFQAISMILVMVLIFISLIGAVYTTIQTTKKMNQAVEVAESNGHVAGTLASVSDSMLKFQESNTRLIGELKLLYSDCKIPPTE